MLGANYHVSTPRASAKRSRENASRAHVPWQPPHKQSPPAPPPRPWPLPATNGGSLPRTAPPWPSPRPSLEPPTMSAVRTPRAPAKRSRAHRTPRTRQLLATSPPKPFHATSALQGAPFHNCFLPTLHASPPAIPEDRRGGFAAPPPPQPSTQTPHTTIPDTATPLPRPPSAKSRPHRARVQNPV